MNQPIRGTVADIHGAECVHRVVNRATGAVIECHQPALQSSSVNHGWQCEKHYNQARFGKGAKK